MTREQLFDAVATAKKEMRTALQTVYNALNQGQQKQIVKNEEVKKIFDIYGVEYQE